MRTLQANSSPLEVFTMTPERYLAGTRGAQDIWAAWGRGLRLPPAPWPIIDDPLPLLGGAACVEVWRSPTPLRYERALGFHASYGRDLSFVAASGEDRGELSAIAERVYSGLRRLLTRLGTPHPLRLWNRVPRINEQQDGLERYRRFCVGRHEAFRRDWRLDPSRFPAASAVGSSGGPLWVCAFSARRPGLPVENPRQVSAYRYPGAYGPKSPSFARALVSGAGEGALLFISGTASILGHESMHLGSVAEQTRLSLSNLRAVCRRSGRVSGLGFPMTPDSASLCVFLRRAEDLPAVRSIIDFPATFLQADICRRELLVEIEGVVRHGV